MVDNVQAVDVLAAGTPALTYAADGDTWTVNAGVLVHSAGSDGVYSARNLTALYNYGTVGSATGSGANFQLDNSTIFNAAGAFIIGFDHGVAVFGNGNTIDNDGTIISLNLNGVRFGSASANSVLLNQGEIFGHDFGVNASSAATGDIVRNSGTIRGDEIGVRVYTSPGLNTTVVNQVGGTIQGLLAAVRTDIDGAMVLTNRGLLKGIVNFDAVNENDLVRNFQNIKGQVFLGSGNDVFNGLTGTSGKVFGEDGLDKLYGGIFSDRFNGGLGNDLLVGRGARDFFFFDTAIFPVANIDTINGFTPGLDEIIVDDDVFLGIGPVGALAAGRFVNGPGFTTPGQRFNYNPFNGFVFYDANGSTGGGNGPIAFAKLAVGLGVGFFDFTVNA